MDRSTTAKKFKGLKIQLLMTFASAKWT